MVAPVAFDMAKPRYARVIEQLLRDAGLKKSDLSRATGINDSTISAITTGRQMLRDEHRNKIAAFFGLSRGRFDALVAGVEEPADSPASFEDRVADLPVDQRRAHWFLHQITQALGSEKVNTILRAAAETFSVELIPLPSDPIGAKEFADYLKRFAPTPPPPPPNAPTNAPTTTPTIRGPAFKGAHGGIEHLEIDTAPVPPAAPIHVKRKTS